MSGFDIGSVHLDGRAVLAPMAGVSDAAFRTLCLEQGAALVYTEMVSAKALCYNDRKTAALLHIPQHGRPVAAQIFGHEPESMAEGARRALEICHADIIDINMGCPVGKIVKSGDGSALMRTPELAGEVAAAVVNAVDVPVTVKIRKGWDAGSVNCVEVAGILEQAGVAAIAVHGRTRVQMYSGRADWDAIREVAAAVRVPVIANGDDQNTLKALKDLDKRIITFGYSSINDYYPANIEHVDGVTISFDLCRDSEILTPIRLHVPGDHNILNAIAACIAAHEVGASWEQCAKGLDAFHGAQRRFEVLGKFGGITVADDYGHHPTEITATLTAAKKLPFKRVWAVHQPFTYSRTAMLLDDFAKALSIADRVVLSEIMGSREKNTWNIYAKDLAEKIPGCVWFPEFPEIADYVVAHAEPGDLIITLGCGDVNKCAHMMVDLLSKKYGG